MTADKTGDDHSAAEKLRSLKLAIFDLDGTLVEFPHDYLFSETARILSEFGHPPVDGPELEDCFSDFDFFRFVQSEHERNNFIEHFWKAFDWNHFPKPRLLPGVIELLRGLREAGISCAIATARLESEAQVRESLEGTEIASFMEVIAPRLDEHQDWQDKKPQIQRVVESLGISLNDAMMVGDIPPDVTCAQELGVGLTVGVQSGGIKKHVLAAAEPDLLLDDIRSLSRLIAE